MISILKLACVLLTAQQFTVRVCDPVPDFVVCVEPEIAVHVDESEQKGCYLVIFTTRTCGPCQRFTRDELPKIRKAGHKVEIIDLNNDESNQRYAKEVTLVPTFWIVDLKTQKTIWKRTSAAMKAADLIEQLRLASGGKIDSPTEKSCTCSNLCTCGCNAGKPCRCNSGRKTVTQSVSEPAQNQVTVSFQKRDLSNSISETWPAVIPINGTTRYSKREVLWHLRGGGNGGNNHSSDAYHSWTLDALTVGQLATIHDADHGVKNGLELPE